MSRIIKSIINSVLKSDNTEYVFIHNHQGKDVEIAKNIDGQALSFESNSLDTNNRFKLITERDLSMDLSILPRFVINTSMMRYQNAKNLSSLLRIPQYNIIYDLSFLKKEGAFSLAQVIDKDINIFFDKEIPKKLFVTNYTIISNLEELKDLINESYKTWKPE